MTKPVFLRTASGLVREVDPVGAFAMTAGTANIGIGQSFILLVAFLYPSADYALTVMIAMVPALFTGLVYALFAIAMPRSGGDYVWVSRTLGPLAGFSGNWAFTFWLFMLWTFQIFVAPTYTSNGLWMIGMGLNSEPLMAAATLMATNPTWMFVVGAVEVALAILAVSVGTKGLTMALKVLLVVGVLGWIAVNVLLLTGTHESFVAGFNKWMAGTTTYEHFLESAPAEGWSPSSYTLAGTFAALPFAFFQYLGFYFSTYVAGEVKEVRKSMFWSVLGTVIVISLSQILGWILFSNIAGREWVQAIVYLWSTGSSAFNFPTAALMYPIALTLTQNTAVWVLVGVGYLFWNMFLLIVMPFVVTRNAFAWSFDRVFPRWIADVNNRFHSPVKTISLLFVFALIMSYIWVFSSSIYYAFVNTTLGLSLAAIFPSVAAIVFASRKRDLFKDSPIKSFKIGTFPLITLSGVISTIFLLYISYAAYTTPAIYGPIGYPALALIIVSFVVGPIIYTSVRSYRQRTENIDIAMAMDEIPPA